MGCQQELCASATQEIGARDVIEGKNVRKLYGKILKYMNLHGMNVVKTQAKCVKRQ